MRKMDTEWRKCDMARWETGNYAEWNDEIKNGNYVSITRGYENVTILVRGTMGSDQDKEQVIDLAQRICDLLNAHDV